MNLKELDQMHEEYIDFCYSCLYIENNINDLNEFLILCKFPICSRELARIENEKINLHKSKLD